MWLRGEDSFEGRAVHVYDGGRRHWDVNPSRYGRGAAGERCIMGRGFIENKKGQVNVSVIRSDNCER